MGGLNRVTAAELVRNFGVWQSRALHAPIVVTHRGRETHLLTPYRASQGDAQGVDAEWTPLLDEMVEAVLIIDAKLCIVRANRAACSILRLSEADLTDVPVHVAIPGFGDGLVWRYIARTLETGEPFSGDVQSPLRTDGWLRIKLVRAGAGVALIFRDVTDELAGFVGLDAARATIRSASTLGHLGHARLSVRGMIEGVDATLRDRIDSSDEALCRVAFASLLPLNKRAGFNAAFEEAMQTGACGPVETALVGRSGEAFPARLGLVRIAGPYAPEGAAVAVSWEPPLTPPCGALPSPH